MTQSFALSTMQSDRSDLQPISSVDRDREGSHQSLHPRGGVASGIRTLRERAAFRLLHGT